MVGSQPLRRVTIYTDGACRHNPGPGGYGAVLIYIDGRGEEHTLELSQGYRLTTNNRMELLAVIVALEALKVPCTVKLHSDSKYVVNAFRQHWVEDWERRGWKKSNKKPVENIDLWKRLMPQIERHRVTFIWVKGHAGDTYNERCDTLATGAADDKAHLIEDTGYRA